MSLWFVHITQYSLFLNNIMQLRLYIMNKKSFLSQHSKIFSFLAVRKRDTIHIFFSFSCDDGFVFSDSHRVALTLQVIFQRASGTILSHDTRGQSLAKPPESTDRTDESRPENADNEQQQERVSQRRGFICYIVVKHNEKIRHPKYSGSGTAKDWTEREKGTLKRGGKCTPSSIKTTHQCFFLQNYRR